MRNPLPAEGTRCRGRGERSSTSSVGGAVPALPPRWAEDAHGFAGALPSLWCRKVLAPPGPPQRRRPSSFPTHPHCPRRGGIIRRNHGNPGQCWGCQHLAVPGFPRHHGLTWLCRWRGAAGWVEGRASARGMWCPCPQGTGMHTVASLGYSSVWLSRAAAAGGLSGRRCPPRGVPWSQQLPPCHSQGFPRTLMRLFYFAVLGWSRGGALGQLSPPIPSLLLPDQVRPWAAVPCPPAALTPQGWAS